MKYSIKRQIAGIFIALMAGTIFLCWMINNTLLEKYYIQNKEKSLNKAYNIINTAASDQTLSSDETKIEIQKMCGKYNISVLVLDADAQSILCSTNDVEILGRQLLDYLFLRGAGLKDRHIIKEEKNYTVQILTDPRMKTEYIEIWGVLDNGNLFLFRSAIEGIKDSVAIANRFLIYAGLISSLIGGLIMWFVTKRITKPITELTTISERMTHLDFDAKYSGKSKTELEILGENINVLSETLENTISELKTANNELQKDIEKKEKIDEMRKEFLSNVSHELKTPIALIQGYAEGLKEGINDDADSKDFYCEVIMDEASKMNNMVKKLLTLNQLEFGKDIISMERFDIVTLIKNYLQSAEILAKQNGIQIRMAEYPPISVWADEFKVEEVFANYFSNAINHCEKEKIIDIKLTENDKCIRVSVFNTGNSIPEDSISHIWEKFYKVDKARTREYGGSGVGLSIVKAIMDSLNQKYGVVNYDNGVEFWFELDTNPRNDII